MSPDDLAQSFVTLFVTIDPIGLAPIFLAVTRGMTTAQRRLTALRAAFIAVMVLFVFAVAGESLLNGMGITLPAFRIAGGLLLFAIAFEMVFEKREQRKQESVRRALTHEEIRHIAVFPLAIPLIAGPGAISATILLSAETADWIAFAGLLATIVAILATCLATFTAAGAVERFLGETGRILLTRLLGIILAALSVQFAADGILAIVRAG